MKICVMGMWHLGCVTAACLAEYFETIAYDSDPATINRLSTGRAPIHEPGLDDLIRRGLQSGRLSFTSEITSAAANADIVWIAFDTPVDDDDVANPAFVEEESVQAFATLRDGACVLISSQVPVGFTAKLEKRFESEVAHGRVAFAYSPENLRLGKALAAFQRPERIVVGTRSDATRATLNALFKPFCERIEWMSVESAEMTKHALNAFLAVSITFINEVAALSERLGVDAKEVERGLKTEARIGPKAYLAPGGAFAGGTLARDVSFLGHLGQENHVKTHLLNSVALSNSEHKLWPARKASEFLGTLAGKSIAVLGLAYKPNTDTLRRSSAVELCRWFVDRGASVRAYDPAVKKLPPEEERLIHLCGDAPEALRDSDAVIIATDWESFKDLKTSDFLAMRQPVIIDPNRFLAAEIRTDSRVVYAAVGQPLKTS